MMHDGLILDANKPGADIGPQAYTHVNVGVVLLTESFLGTTCSLRYCIYAGKHFFLYMYHRPALVLFCLRQSPSKRSSRCAISKKFLRVACFGEETAAWSQERLGCHAFMNSLID